MNKRKQRTDLFLLEFAKKARELRQQQNLSYRALSQRCNIDVPDLEKIENGTRCISLSQVIELAIGLRVNPRDLFDFEVPDQD